MAVEWEATDQFGHLYVGESAAEDMDALDADLSLMVTEVLARTPSDVTFSIDTEFGEIAAPNGNQPTHVLRVPWVADGGTTFEAISQRLTSHLDQHPEVAFAVQGPWE